MAFRAMTEAEERLLAALLLAVPDCQLQIAALAELRVESLGDGGMGSFRLAEHSTNEHYPLTEVEFEDEEDGSLVVATLYVDSENYPNEVGVWKVDFSPLGRIPADLPPAKRVTR